jgi:hypothetical protein
MHLANESLSLRSLEKISYQRIGQEYESNTLMTVAMVVAHSDHRLFFFHPQYFAIFSDLCQLLGQVLLLGFLRSG